MAYGDIILNKTSGTWYEWLITTFTHGPYVHCSVDLGNGTNISAHPDPEGISIEQNVGGEVVDVTSQADPQHLFIAMTWLKHQIGKHYSWLDILSAGLHSIGINLYFGQDDHMDCSDLCATYLDILEGKPEIDYRHLDIVSPNDIARKLGVLK